MQVVLAGTAGYVAFAAVVAGENLAGVDLSHIPAPMVALFLLGIVALAAAGVVAMVAASRTFRGDQP